MGNIFTFTRITLALAAIAGLSALSGCTTIGDGDFTRSEFGTGPATLSSEQTGDIGNFLGTVNYRSETDEDGAATFAEVDFASVSVVPVSASTTYTGTFEVAGIENVKFTETSATTGFITGTSFTDGGAITLVANPADNSVTGTSGELSVQGTFSGTDMDGTVTYRGVSGALDGIVTSDGVLGGFHGNNDALVFAGGVQALD